jgi:hypothetical protein
MTAREGEVSSPSLIAVLTSSGSTYDYNLLKHKGASSDTAAFEQESTSALSLCRPVRITLSPSTQHRREAYPKVS